MKERDDSKLMSNTLIQIDDAYWGGKKLDGRRERGATDKTPFIAAMSTNENGHPYQMRFSRVTSFSKNSVIDLASNHLSNGKKIVTDGFLGFEGFNDAGFVHKVIVTGGGHDSI